MGIDVIQGFLHKPHADGRANIGLAESKGFLPIPYAVEAPAVRGARKEYEAGKIRAIGVSNFAPAHLEPLLAQCRIKPMVNQISFYPGHIQRETAAFCREQGIFVED